MDDGVAAVAVAAYPGRDKRIKNIDELALVQELLDVEDAIIMSQDDRRTYLCYSTYYALQRFVH